MCTEATGNILENLFLENVHLKIINNFYNKSFCLKQTHCLKMACFLLFKYEFCFCACVNTTNSLQVSALFMYRAVDLPSGRH
jgi:hypothetical protein